MSTNNIKKITFLGDVTCDRPLLEGSRCAEGGYDFEDVFAEMRSFLNQSDYVIANLETVCAGSGNNFQSEFLLYNSPDQLIAAIKNGGIHFVTTANNHCLDQGVSGLKRTLSILDQHGIEHSGTYYNPAERENIKVISVGGLKIAILSYTYGTNETNTGIELDETNDYLVGLLKQQVDTTKHLNGLKGFLLSRLTAAQKRAIKRIINRGKLRLGVVYFKPYTDVIRDGDTENAYLEKVKRDISRAREKADFVVVCPHMGGQFNEEPGEYSDFLVDFLRKNGADIIVGNHPHVVQRAYARDGNVAAYSLGSFNLSVSADYIVHDSLPEYSMALHIYMNELTKKIEKTAFSILKIEEKDSHKITVYPVERWAEEHYSDKLQEEVDKIYNRIMGTQIKHVTIEKEYSL